MTVRALVVLTAAAVFAVHCSSSNSAAVSSGQAAVSRVEQMLKAGGCKQYLIGHVEFENLGNRPSDREQGIKVVQQVRVHFAIAENRGGFFGAYQQYILADEQFHRSYASRNEGQDKYIQAAIVDHCFRGGQTQATGGPGLVSVSSCAPGAHPTNVSCGKVSGAGAIAVADLDKVLKGGECRRYLIGNVEVSNWELGPAERAKGIKSKQQVNVYFAYDTKDAVQRGTQGYLILDGQIDRSYGEGQAARVLDTCIK
jgi:hypothetical protein